MNRTDSSESPLQAIIQLDQLDRICDWSAGAVAMFGWQREEVLGLTCRDCLIEPDGYETYERWRRETPHRALEQLPARHKHGERVDALFKLERSDPSKAEISVRALVSVSEVADRARAEEEVRRQQWLLQYILNFVPHAIFWKDREDRFLGGNLNFLNNALGVSSVEEALGKNDFDFFPKEQAEYFRRCDERVMSTGEPMLDLEEPLSQKGEVRFLLTSKVPLKDESGAITGVLGSFADITARKRMEEELELARRQAEAAARAKSEFLATVSHELRTPLTLILGPLEMMLASDGVPPAIRTELARIQRNACRLHDLVNDILDYSKIEAGKATVRWEAIDVGRVVSEMVADATASARGRSVELSCTCGPVGLVCLDRRKFEKIVLNLLGNALKFTPPGGRIDVRVDAIGRELVLAVKDTGVGIPADQQQLLFSKFQQLDSSAARRYEGTGLGLALVKEFAELMDGAVTMTSEVGRGSEFTVTIPIVDRTVTETPDEVPRPHRPASEPVHDEPRAASDRPATAPRLLVVEDNADMRGYICNVLADEFFVTAVANGEEALRAVRAELPALVVTDVMMPEMDGLELVSHLKADPALRTIPVILLTAKTDRSDMVAGLRLGADDYVGKPFSAVELKARIHAALRLRAALDDVRLQRERAFHAEKMSALGMLIAGLSHELNNPLAAISLGLEVLAKTPPSEDPMSRRAIDMIRRQTERCAGLVGSLLTFSRKKPLVTEEVEVPALLGRVVALAAPLAERRGIDLRSNWSTLSPETTLHGCVQELETALLNLIGNALVATPKGGRVEVGVTRDDRDGQSGVTISVVDTGSGIDKAVLPRIFDPFFTTKDPGEGTGMGLPLTRSIIDSHGGTITVDSEMNVGTRFEIWLPERCAAREVRIGA